MQQVFTNDRHRNGHKENIGLSILYLLLSFPLSLLYFLFVVIGLAVGMSTVVIWIGIPILLITMAGLRGIAIVERDLAASMLHIEMPRTGREHHGERGRGWWNWLKSNASDPLTWRSLLYVLVKFPLGISAFVIALTLPILSLTLLLNPLSYLLSTYIYSLVNASGSHYHEWMLFMYIDGHFDPLTFVLSFLATPLGVLCWLATRWLLNGMAHGLGAFTRGMLTTYSYEQVRIQPKYELYS
ncbi:sensor domain-containing protein [Tengunoibacter tsumagoiensis]|uniref:Putative sensor domain-containing protein n=1 Tax=Tengunoibacter tsumagoiensis TaxID=2014871 RepID=A0A401ZTX7_9CHLR|nr:sensor domain-containing protein [Tengunoibacter tsumagoiensis]GCE10313.1 hypothetical protein KTT_01720 [Tengunoibacter tsumagoiensis]